MKQITPHLSKTLIEPFYYISRMDLLSHPQTTAVVRFTVERGFGNQSMHIIFDEKWIYLRQYYGYVLNTIGLHWSYYFINVKVFVIATKINLNLWNKCKRPLANKSLFPCCHYCYHIPTNFTTEYIKYVACHSRNACNTMMTSNPTPPCRSIYLLTIKTNKVVEKISFKKNIYNSI